MTRCQWAATSLLAASTVTLMAFVAGCSDRQESATQPATGYGAMVQPPEPAPPRLLAQAPPHQGVRRGLPESNPDLREAHKRLLDAKRVLLEYQVEILEMELYKELAIKRPLRHAFAGRKAPETDEERSFMDRMHNRPTPTPEQEEARDRRIKRASASLEEALARYYEVDLRRMRLVTMLIRDLTSAEVDELRRAGRAIDSDPQVAEIAERYKR